VRRVRRGMTGFSRWRAFVASADVFWAIRFFGRGDAGRDEHGNLTAGEKLSIVWQRGWRTDGWRQCEDEMSVRATGTDLDRCLV